MNLPETLRTISTIAGDGTARNSGDGGPAVSSAVVTPVVVAVDQSGNLFVAEATASVVRRIDSGSGIITTIAATFRNISTPLGIAVDASTNVYVSDLSSVVWKIRGAFWSAVNIYAGKRGKHSYSGDGGAATSATLQFPNGLGIDTLNSYLYIADWGNNVIRRIAMNTGIISTVAGNSQHYGWTGDGGPATSASLYGPIAIAVDSNGDVFISEKQNNVVRKIASDSGYIYTVAGTGNRTRGIAGYAGDGGAATSALLREPAAIAVDAAGNLYIADAGNKRIRMVNGSDCSISTVVGGGAALGDGGPATAAQLANPVGLTMMTSPGSVSTSGSIFPTSIAMFIADGTGNRVRGVRMPFYPPFYPQHGYCALPTVQPTSAPTTAAPSCEPTTAQPTVSHKPTLTPSSIPTSPSTTPSSSSSITPSMSTPSNSWQLQLQITQVS
jgi:hypothetical protein